MLYHKRGILYLPLYRVYPHWRCTAPRGGWWCRGGWGKKLRRDAGHLESLWGKKEKWQQSGLLVYPLLIVLEISDLCKHTHTPDVFLYTPPRSHTHAHTHNSSDRDRCRDALMHTHISSLTPCNRCSAPQPLVFHCCISRHWAVIGSVTAQ